jgi:hypothetical protein
MYLEDTITMQGKEVDSSKTFNDNKYFMSNTIKYIYIQTYGKMVRQFADRLFYYTN